MPALNTINQINAQIMNYAPAVVLAAQAFGENSTGPEKQSKVVRVLTGIEVGTGQLETNPNPLVASTAGLVNLIVQLAKLFQHPAFVPGLPTAQP